MILLVSIHETAEAEINEAADFYDIECPGLGSDLIDEIQKTLVHLCSFPDASPLPQIILSPTPLHQILPNNGHPHSGAPTDSVNRANV